METNSFINVKPTTTVGMLAKSLSIYFVILSKQTLNLALNFTRKLMSPLIFQTKDCAREAREGPRILMSLRVDFGPIG